VHTALLCLAVAFLVFYDRCHGALDRFACQPCSILGLLHSQINAFSPHGPPSPNATLREGLTGAWSTSI
jgi:hypothetical protein